MSTSSKNANGYFGTRVPIWLRERIEQEARRIGNVKPDKRPLKGNQGFLMAAAVVWINLPDNLRHQLAEDLLGGTERSEASTRRIWESSPLSDWCRDLQDMADAGMVRQPGGSPPDTGDRSESAPSRASAQGTSRKRGRKGA